MSDSVLYRDLLLEAQGLFDGIDDPIANAANFSAVLWHGLEGLNWAGFYFVKGGSLLLGPFQGKPACVRIPMGKGVCGAAAARKETLIVPDVHAFPGHIACDSASNSEIVVPLIRDEVVLGVLDLDSPHFGRFGPEDQKGLEALAAAFVAASQF